MKKIALPLVLLVCSTVSAAEPPVDAFLRMYNSIYKGLCTVANEAAWLASTDVSEAHEAGRTVANTALAVFQGDRGIIEAARSFLSDRRNLPPIVARELDKILLAAAEGPGTIPEITRERVAAESHQSSVMDGFTFHIDGKPVSANDIDDTLQHSRDLAMRLKAWEASKEIGKPLKPGIVRLQRLRNQVAREMNHSGYFALEVADYDMTDAEMMKMLDGFVADTRPLYRKLHAYVRMKLAERYHQPVPKLIPAHWIDNRWAQEWDGVAEGAVDLDPLFKDKKPEWIVQTAERFYTSMGFPPLPKSFWQKSDLYALPADAKRHKNAHASAWHIDLDGDVRSLMSVKPDAQWFFTAHHELGHIYYFLSYSRPEVPYILRQGANRAMHEAVGELASIAAKQPAYLEAVGVLAEGLQDRSAAAAPRRGADLGDPVHRLERGDDGALRARPVSEGSAAVGVAEALVEVRRRVPGRGAAVAAAGQRLRRVHEDAYQRQPGRVLPIRDRGGDQVSAARSHLSARSCIPIRTRAATTGTRRSATSCARSWSRARRGRSTTSSRRRRASRCRRAR